MDNYKYCTRDPKFKVGIFGNVNASKSTLINYLMDYNMAESLKIINTCIKDYPNHIIVLSHIDNKTKQFVKNIIKKLFNRNISVDMQICHNSFHILNDKLNEHYTNFKKKKNYLKEF